MKRFSPQYRNDLKRFTCGSFRNWAPILFIASLLAISADCQFVPGSGGAIPLIAPLQGVPDQIGGLTVAKNDRRNYVFFTGTHAELEFRFPPPSTHQASGYRVQRSLNGTSGWEDHPHDGGFLETATAAQDGFVFTPDGAYHYRLLVQGGPRNGQVSNIVFAAPSTVDSSFAGWSLDESMWITGVMAPMVGRGLQAGFSVVKLEDGSPVLNALTYQWYRVNPLSSEMTLIPGATELTYVTTEADVGGYELRCLATGDGVNAGGFVQIGSSWGVLFPNAAYATNVTATGFRLNLRKSVPSLPPQELVLDYWNGSEMVVLPVTSINALEGNASFDLAVAIPDDVTELNLRNESDVWLIGQEFSFDPGMPPHFMQSLRIVVRTAFDVWVASNPAIPADRRGELDRNGPLDLQNFMAYAMGLDPITALAADLPKMEATDPAAGTLHFIYRRARFLNDVILVPKISTDLAHWEKATVVSEMVIEEGGDWQRVDALISATPATNLFMRLEAAKPAW